MNIAKTLSTMSLAFALQAGALVTATVVLAPSEAAAAVSKKKAQKKVQKKSQKKAAARGSAKKLNNVGDDTTPGNLPRGGGAKWSGGNGGTKIEDQNKENEHGPGRNF